MGHAFIPALQVVAPHRSDFPRYLHIGVVFTTFEDTKAALRAASTMSAGLEADIDLIVPHVVPFPLPLGRPSVPPAFTLCRLTELAEDAGVLPSIFVYFCRDRLETLLQVLEPGSVVLMGSRERWFWTKIPRLAKSLRKRGHQVILIGT